MKIKKVTKFKSYKSKSRRKTDLKHDIYHTFFGGAIYTNTIPVGDPHIFAILDLNNFFRNTFSLAITFKHPTIDIY